MSHSLKSPANIAALKGLNVYERLYRIVSFTGNLDHHISPEAVYYLSVLLGNQDWMDDLHHVRRGFPRAARRQYFQRWVHDEMKKALLLHFEEILKDSGSRLFTISRQNRCASIFRNNMQWRRWKSGYQGAIVKSSHIDTIEETKRFVRFFEKRWRLDSPKTKHEQDFVWENYRDSTSLDWIFNATYFNDRLNEMEKECGALYESAPH